MQEIKVDPKRVRQTASDIRNSARQLRNELSTIDRIEDMIESAWKSRYTRSYLNILENTLGHLKSAANSLDSVSGNLDSIAGTVERAEAELQRIMSGHGGGVSGGGSGGGGGF